MNENEPSKETTTETTTTAAAEAVSVSSLAPTVTQAPVGADPRDAEIAELKHRLEVESAEQGRLRKVNDELKEAREEIARLKADNAKLTQRRPDDFLSEDERKLLDDEQLALIDKVARERAAEVSASQKAENERLRAEMAQRDASAAIAARAQFDAEVERLAPGLAAAVGGRASEWKKWSSAPRRAASVAAAFANNDAATVAEFLQEFAQLSGIRANGDGIAARPQTSFSPTGGSHPVSTGGDTSTYTVEQYSQAMRQASADFSAGRITQDEYRAIKKKFDVALSEGRIVPR